MNEDAAGSAAREARLDEVIAEYLAESEAGRSPNREQFLSRYLDLADDLAEFLNDRERIRLLVRPLADAADDTRPACPRCHSSLNTVAPGSTCDRCGWSLITAAGDDPFPAPHHFGRIDLMEVIGRGAFGTVYRGWDREMRRYVAVKVLRMTPLTTPEHIERFRRDGRSAAQLNHPGIVTVHEVGEADGVPYLVSTFVPGGTLADLIKSDRPEPKQSAEIVAAVADALHHAHQKRVIHRDVKPANILMKERSVPLLTDFGLALWEAGNTTLTEDAPLGTLFYASPEQALGRGHEADCRSDVYGLGVVLYELLTGERPFTGRLGAVLKQIESADPRPPRTLDDRVPKDLETICLKCLRKDPARRFASAAELAAELRRYLAGEPIRTRPVGPGERLVLWARRNPALAIAFGLTAALLAATTAVSVAWAYHADQQSDKIRKAFSQVQQVTAETEFDRGLAEAERGDVALGMLWMAQSLETAPDGSGREWAVRVNLDAWRRQLVVLADCKDPPPGRVLAFAPDGKTAWFVEPDDRTVRCWDLSSGRVVGPPLEHPGVGVHCAAVSPNGQQIACGSRNSGVSVWHVAGAKLEAAPSDRPVRGLVYSSDGRELFLVLGNDRSKSPIETTCWLWSGGEMRQVGGRSGGTDWMAAAAAPDGRTLYTSSAEDKEIHGRDAATGEVQERILRHPSPIKVLAVCPKGRRVLTGGDDRLARLWDLPTGRLLGVLNHRKPVTAVAFAAGGTMLLTASQDDAIRVWDAPAEDESLAGVVLPRAVRAVAVSPDGGLVATGSDDYYVRLWRVSDGRLEARGQALRQPSPLRSVGFSPDGRTLVAVPFTTKGAHLWDPITGTQTGTFEHPDLVRQVIPSPNGKLVATVGYLGGVRVWDGWTGRAAATHVLAAGFEVSAAAFRGDSRELVAGDYRGGVHRWDSVTGLQLGSGNLHAGEVRVVRSHPTNANTLLTADAAGVAQLSDVGVLNPTGPTLSHQFAITEAVASPDGRVVLTGGNDGLTRIWDAETGRAVARPLQHGGWVRAVAVSRSNRWVVTASDDGTARVWALESGRPIGAPVHHGRSANCAAIDPNDRWVVTGGEDRTVRLIPAPTERRGEPGRVAEWVRVATGAELDHPHSLRPMSPSEWRERSAAARP